MVCRRIGFVNVNSCIFLWQRSLSGNLSNIYSETKSQAVAYASRVLDGTLTQYR